MSSFRFYDLLLLFLHVLLPRSSHCSPPISPSFNSIQFFISFHTEQYNFNCLVINSINKFYRRSRSFQFSYSRFSFSLIICMLRGNSNLLYPALHFGHCIVTNTKVAGFLSGWRRPKGRRCSSRVSIMCYVNRFRSWKTYSCIHNKKT